MLTQYTGGPGRNASHVGRDWNEGNGDEDDDDDEDDDEKRDNDNTQLEASLSSSSLSSSVLSCLALQLLPPTEAGRFRRLEGRSEVI